MFRKLLPGLLIFVVAAALVAGLLLKDNLNGFISKKMKQEAGTEVVLSGEAWVDSLFNYAKNGKDYQFSLLQFKSTGCTICKRMEPELDKLRATNQPKINVTVLNVMNPNSQNLMKYFGISAVPTQLLLDRQGIEVFRKYGFITAENILQQAQY